MLVLSFDECYEICFRQNCTFSFALFVHFHLTFTVIMKRNNFTMTELANQLNCSRQNLSNKMSRNNFDERELTAIANALGCEIEINFVNRETGEKIEL